MRLLALTVTILCGLSGPAAHAGSLFFEYCDKPSRVRSFVGPRLLNPVETKAGLDLMVALREANGLTKYSIPDLRALVRDNGLFVSSPFLRADSSPDEKLDELCVILATGGVAYVVSEAVKNNQDVLDQQAKEEAIHRTAAHSDQVCFDEIKERRAQGRP